MSTKQTVEGTLDRLTAQIFHCLTVPLRPLYHVVKEMTGASGSWAKLVMRFTDLTGKGLYAELRGKSRADVLQKAEPYLKAPIQVKNLKTTKNNFFPHISVWGSSFVGWHPARIRRSFRPPRPLLRRSLTLTHSLTHSFFTSLTHSLTQHKISRLTHSLTHSPHSLTHSLTHSHSQSLSSRDCRRGCGARCRRWAPLSLRRRSTQSLQKGLRPRSLQWQAQYPEPPEGAAARVVAAGPPSLSAVAGAVPRASRMGLRRALSPLGPPRSLQWQAQYPEPPERGCGARCRRWAPLALCCGRRSTQSLQKGLRRALSPLGPLRFCALLPL